MKEMGAVCVHNAITNENEGPSSINDDPSLVGVLRCM